MTTHIYILLKDQKAISSIKKAIRLDTIIIDNIQNIPDTAIISGRNIFIIEACLLSNKDINLLQKISLENGLICIAKPYSAEQRLSLLKHGVDYLLNDDFESAELEAYIKKINKRLNTYDSPSSWTLYQHQRILKKPDLSILKLTTTEFLILIELLKNPCEITFRKSMLKNLNYSKYINADLRLNTNICRLRSKLQLFDNRLSIICWKRMGYMFTGPKININFENILDT